MMPESGGYTVYLKRALGLYAGFVIGWTDWLSTCSSAALAALVIGEYTTILFGTSSVARARDRLRRGAGLCAAAMEGDQRRRHGAEPDRDREDLRFRHPDRCMLYPGSGLSRRRRIGDANRHFHCWPRSSSPCNRWSSPTMATTEWSTSPVSSRTPLATSRGRSSAEYWLSP